MDLSLTADQRDMQAGLRELLEHLCTAEIVRGYRTPDASAPPARLWRELAAFGALGLAVSTTLGGQGASLFDLGLAYEEAGRVLCPTPYYSSSFTALVIDRLGTDVLREAWIPKLISGSSIGTSALWSRSGDRLPGSRPAAAATPEGWLVNGTVDFVPDADFADIIVIAADARGSSGVLSTLVFLASPQDPGITMTRHRTFGHDVQCRIDLTDHAVSGSSVLAAPGGDDTPRALDWLLSAAVALQCMEMAGGARAVLDRTAEYLKVREQFGRPIGSFQAAQHHVANMRIGIDAARLAALQAMWWVSEGATAAREVAIAKARCGDAYKFATLTAHQLHGGMGYLRETDLHMWSERAKVTELQYGAWDTQLTAIAAQLGL